MSDESSERQGGLGGGPTSGGVGSRADDDNLSGLSGPGDLADTTGRDADPDFRTSFGGGSSAGSNYGEGVTGEGSVRKGCGGGDDCGAASGYARALRSV